MRSSSLRTLLLALAMVVQTIAGGWGGARATASNAHPAFSAHCGKLLLKAPFSARKDVGKPASEGDHAGCENCSLCDQSEEASLGAMTPVVETIRPRALAARAPVDAPGSISRLVSAHEARGPPASPIAG